MLQTKLYVPVLFRCFYMRTAIYISICPGSKIMYSYVFYAGIQFYTHCISEMTVAMFVFIYHHFCCYILQNVIMFTFSCSKYQTDFQSS